MKNWQSIALCTVLATTLVACSSDDDGDSAADPVSVADGNTAGDDGADTGVASTDTGGTAGDETTGGDAGATDGDATTGGTTATTGDDDSAPDDSASDDGATDGDTATGGDTTTTGGDDGAADDGATGGDTDGDTGGTTTGASDTGGGDTGGGDTGANEAVDVPVSMVGSTPRPATDPFGYTLEFDDEVSDGVPTQPKNLRADLVSSNWAEFSWAPSNDDQGVTSYLIERSDGVSYTLTSELEPGLSLDGGTYDEFRNYWLNTYFMDCNPTRFTFVPGSQKDLDAPWNCANTRPMEGATYSYTVTAFDADGNASAASDPLDITFGGGDDAVPSRVSDFIDGFDVVWNDEFEGDSLDSERWQTELVFGDDVFINGEQQYFVPVLEGTGVSHDPFELTDQGTLKINAIRTPDNDRAALPDSCLETDPILANMADRDRCEFLSGALSTHDRMQFVYGYTEARLRASDVSGALSSFYLYHRYAGENNVEAGTFYQHGPEIDILEYLGENPFGDEDAFQVHHFIDVNTGMIRSSPTNNHAKEDGGIYGGEFHTFSALWEPNLVIWYIDGVEVRRIDGPMVSQQPMNIINYLVTGSGWAPEPDNDNPPISLEVDYIRVYQRDQFKASMSCGIPGSGTACPAVQ